MNRLLLALAATVAMALPSHAIPRYETSSDTVPGNFTSVTAAIPASSTVVTLTAPSRHVVIKSDASAAVMYIRLDGGTCTSANFKIDSGGAVALDGLPGINSVTILGASATGNYSILAW